MSRSPKKETRRKTIVANLPWDQLVNESSKAFFAFCAYKDLGSDRNLTMLKNRIDGSYTVLRAWKFRYNWDERIEQHDRFLERKKLEVEIDEVTAMKKRQRGVAQSFWELINLQLCALIKAAKKDKDKLVLSPDQLHRLAEFASKLERINLDEPSDIVGGHEKSRRKKLQELFEKKGAQGAIEMLNIQLEE